MWVWIIENFLVRPRFRFLYMNTQPVPLRVWDSGRTWDRTPDRVQNELWVLPP